MKTVIIYTDGSCLRNPGGSGGWAAVLFFNGVFGTVYGGVRKTTNNRMELRAIIEGLAHLKQPCEVTVLTDSQVAIAGWRAMHNMKKRKKLKNMDLLLRLYELCGVHEVIMKYVPGHAGNVNNEWADQLADREAKVAANEIDEGYENRTVETFTPDKETPSMAF